MISYLYCKNNQWVNKCQKGKIASGLLVILGCAVLGILYLIQVNGAVTKGYKIREFQKTLNEVQETNQELQVQLADWQNLPKVKELIENLGMVSVREMSFLKISEIEMVAAR